MNRTPYLFLALSVVGLAALAIALATGAPPPTCAAGATIKVPDDYPTIQAAIHAATDGDIILVAEGVYLENLAITESLTLSGGWDSSFTARYPGASVIDAQGLGRAVSITCASSATVVTIDGFTIQNGDASGLGLPIKLTIPVSDYGGGRSKTAPRPPGPDVDPAGQAAELRVHLTDLAARGLYPGGASALQSMLAQLDWRTAQAIQSRARARSLAGPRPTASKQGPGAGGGVYSWNASLHLLNSTLVDNVASQDATGAGGGVYVGLAMPGGVHIAGNVIVQNTASGSGDGTGGGLYVYQSPGAIIEDNGFMDNVGSAGGYATTGVGGALELDSSPHAVVRRNDFERNTANAAWDATGGAGGGIHLQYCHSAELYANRLRGNLATLRNHGNGGALFLFESEDVRLTENVITENWAAMFGEEYINGGGVLLDRGDRVVFTGNVVAANVAGLYVRGVMGDVCQGGGLLVGLTNSAQVTINTITGNIACARHYGGGQVGAANGGGGVIQITDAAQVSGNTFTANVASLSDLSGLGGGLYVDGTYDSHIYGNLFQENRGGTEGLGQGGALVLIGWSGEHRDTTVEGNLLLRNWGSAAPVDSTGGACADTFTTGSTYINNVVAGNAATQGGGVVLFSTSQSQLINNTLVDNGDSAVIVDGPSPTGLINNIIVSHTVGITVAAGATVTMRYTLWAGNGTDIAGAGAISHTYPVTGAPAFRDPVNHDYHLTVASAARDAGDPAGVPPAPAYDADGVARPQGARVDIGAYEWRGHWLYLPLACKRWPTVGWAVGDSIGGYGTILHTTDGGATWVRQGSPADIPDTGLLEVSAVDDQNAWVVGPRVILRTRDGGQTWETQTLPADLPAGFELMSVKAIDRHTAWAVGTLDVLLGTTDGQTWTIMPRSADLHLALPVHYSGVDAADATHLWAVGSFGPGDRGNPVIAFYDGIQWRRQGAGAIISDHSAALIGVSVLNQNTVWAVGGADMTTPFPLVKTTDGGATWQQVGPPAIPGMDTNRVVVVTADIGWVSGDDGNVVYTTDAGATWYSVNVPSAYLLGVTATDDKTAWVVGPGLGGTPPGIIAHTTDAQHWEVQSDPSWPNINGISFVSARR